MLGDPKQRKKYDRDGHPPSAGNSPKKASPAAPTAPPTPPAPAPAPAPSAPPPPPSQHEHVPQHAAGAWAGGVNVVDGGWEGMPVNGGYGQGWVSLSLVSIVYRVLLIAHVVQCRVFTGFFVFLS